MKSTIFSFAFILLAFTGSSQGFNINVFTGVSNYAGDLHDKTFTLSQSHLAGGLGLSYDLSDRISIKFGVILGKISGDDKFGKNVTRNLNFSSGLLEGSLGLEYYLTPLGRHLLTPYVFAGAAMFHFSPYTYDKSGNKYYLQSLTTEGQGLVSGRNPYKLSQFAIPFGGGVKWALSNNINVGWELGFRKLFTDYLDDVSTDYIDRNVLLAGRGAKAVELSYRGGEIKNGSQQYPVAGSQRGNRSPKDRYYFTGLTLSFRLVGRYSEYGCPGQVL